MTHAIAKDAHLYGREGSTDQRLPSTTVLVLHLANRRHAWLWAGVAARARVDNGDGIARALGHRLMDLHALLLLSRSLVVVEGGLIEGARGRKEEGRGRLSRLLKRRCLWRARRQGGAIRGGCRVDGVELQTVNTNDLGHCSEC